MNESRDSKNQDWYRARTYTPEKLVLARKILADIQSGKKVFDAIREHPLPDGDGFLGKHLLVAAYRELVADGEWDEDPAVFSKIRMKPTRTLSGVTIVTVLTKPYPCPGKCIFCPTDERMPKSYLIDEPGAMRGLHHDFDPFDQVSSRLEALHAVGHPTDKIELLILGGTWNVYKKTYQEWFIQRCFDAMNDGAPSGSLHEAQQINENAHHRNVGLVVETRPDQITNKELIWMRSIGVTKVQMGSQSQDDAILFRNNRGHTVLDTKKAVADLRRAGFKIVLHWMPNLLGATLSSDREDFSRLWDGICPDEIKIYPTQLLSNTGLFGYWQKGEYIPYTTDELVELIADIKLTIPKYCRVNRIIRDIPSHHVIDGNKRTSLRMDVKRTLHTRGMSCSCIRCREVRNQLVDIETLTQNEMIYHAHGAKEHFLSFVTPNDKLAGYLRLSLPEDKNIEPVVEELQSAAIIREVHVYGQSLKVGEEKDGAAQHIGLGTRLISLAEDISRTAGFDRIAVISAVGTRQYYLRLGFQRGEYYMLKAL